MSQSIEVVAVPESIPRLMAFSSDAEHALALSAEQGYLMRLTIEEIATNIIKYGYTPGPPWPIQVICGYEHRQLKVTIRDRGRTFDPHDAPPPDLTSDLATRSVGGLGLFLVTELADDLTYHHDPASGWNELVILKRAEASNV
jgi:anti-sigma regulatory factor (Ser/Thr protein kinase)